jgi:hypothetical protein
MMQDRGFAGASAYRESLRQAGSRDARAWRAGAIGESIVGRMLADAAVRTVHDRRVPGSDANIDHIAIAPSGVYVIDAKNYTDRPRVDTYAGSDTTPRRLLIGREDHTHLVHAVRRQVRVVEAALDDPTVSVSPRPMESRRCSQCRVRWLRRELMLCTGSWEPCSSRHDRAEAAERVGDTGLEPMTSSV